jgi:serine phosphatase RsbU (regulator of sigma subunit)
MVPAMSARWEAAELLRRLDERGPARLSAVVARYLGECLDARWTSILLIDYEQSTLERLDEHAPGRSVESVPLEGSRLGTAYREQSVESEERPDGLLVGVPITLRSDRLGMLEVLLPIGAEAAVVRSVQQTAHVLAYVLVAADRYTDRYEQARRRRPLLLAAEMQWQLLPALALRRPDFALAGRIFPAYEVGGDNFDHVSEGSSLTLGITDAMGHALRASILTALTVNALRNARRGGADIAAQMTTADAVVREQFGGAQFVTSLLLAVDLPTGRTSAVVAGHPPPLLLREGRLETLELESQLPIGLDDEPYYRPQQLLLRPGDRLLLVSDGLLEAQREPGVEYGDTRLEEVLLATRHLPPQETARLVLQDMGVWQAGSAPRDDATLLCLDYRPS